MPTESRSAREEAAMPKHHPRRQLAIVARPSRSNWRRLFPVALAALILAVGASVAYAPPAAASSTITGYAKVGPANGHLQEAWSTLYPSSGSLVQVTHTYAYTWFGGFTGGSFTVLKDAAGVPIWTTRLQAYGVNGSLFGGNNRWDTYTEAIPADIAARTAALEPQLIWAPTWGTLRWAYEGLCNILLLPCPPFPG
jgi:hypothetical protein